MSRPHRVVIWGPGHIGGTVLREMLRRPHEFEVVGVRVYSDAKNGCDIGELAGLGKVGVTATNDPEAVLALDADCAVYTAQPFDLAQVTEDAIALLRSGKNVVSTTSFHCPQLHGPDYVERLREACLQGNATLHGTGPHPPFMVERLAMTITGLFTAVRHIKLIEAVEASEALAGMAPEFLSAVGWGLPVEQIKPDNLSALLVSPYYKGAIAYAANALYGAPAEEVRFEHDHFGIPADRDYTFPNATIPKGSTLTVAHVYRGYIGDHHFFTNEEYFYVGAEHKKAIFGSDGPPFGPFHGDANYVLEVEGEPNAVTVQLDIERRTDDGLPVITHVSVAMLLQAIAHVVDAQPGVLHPHVEPHFRALSPVPATGAL